MENSIFATQKKKKKKKRKEKDIQENPCLGYYKVKFIIYKISQFNQFNWIFNKKRHRLSVNVV